MVPSPWSGMAWYGLERGADVPGRLEASRRECERVSLCHPRLACSRLCAWQTFGVSERGRHDMRKLRLCLCLCPWWEKKCQSDVLRGFACIFEMMRKYQPTLLSDCALLPCPRTPRLTLQIGCTLACCTASVHPPPHTALVSAASTAAPSSLDSLRPSCITASVPIVTSPPVLDSNRTEGQDIRLSGSDDRMGWVPHQCSRSSRYWVLKLRANSASVCELCATRASRLAPSRSSRVRALSSQSPSLFPIAPLEWLNLMPRKEAFGEIPACFFFSAKPNTHTDASRRDETHKRT